MKKRILNEDEVQNILKLYKINTNIREIYNKTKISPCVIERCLLDRGFKLPTKFKYEVDHTIFSNINNEENSYWLGFLFADGHVRKRVGKNIYELKLKLSTKDNDHLNKYKKFLKSTHPISYSISKVKYPNFMSISENVSLSVYSKQIFDDLCNLGCVPNKTYIINKPKIDEHFFRHFIRGYFDGDGCVGMVGINGRIVNFTSSSLIFLEFIKETLMKFGISDTIIKNQKGCYRLNWTNKKDITLIYDYFYNKSSIYLDRKKEKFENILDTYKPIKVIQKNIDGSIKKIWENVSITSRHLGIRKKLILKCCNNEIEYVGGFKWEYDNEKQKTE